MPSGPKRRRAAKKKQEKAQAQEANELTTVSVVKLSIPIEELAKGAVWHEPASVDKELDKDKNTIGEGTDVFKVASVVVEENEVSLLDATSHEDTVVSTDEPFVSEKAESVESCGVVGSDGKETGLVAGETEKKFEQVHDDDMLYDGMMPEEMLERYHDLFSDNDASTLDYDKNKGFFFRDVPVGVPDEATEVEVLAGNEAANDVKAIEDAKSPIAEGFGVFKDVSVVENELLSDMLPEEKKDTNLGALGRSNVSKEMEEPSVLHDQSIEVPQEMKGCTLMASGLSSVSKEMESTSMFLDQSAEAVDGMKDAAQLVSDKDTGFNLPRVGLPAPASYSNVHEKAPSTEIAGCASGALPFVSEEMQDVPTSPISSATVRQVTEIPANSQEIQAVSGETVSPATQNQVYFACPKHCNLDCCFSKLPRSQSDDGSMMACVEELKCTIHSLKEDLLKALEKLDAISY